MSKIVKSPFATVGGRRTLHTIPVVTYPAPTQNAGKPSGDSGGGQQNELSPGEILEQAREEAERILTEARRQAESLLQDAERKAREMVSDAENRVGQVTEEARSQGYQIGFSEGEAAGLDLYRQMIDRALETIRQIEAERQNYLRQSEQQLLELSCAIARRIVGQELKVDSAWTATTVKTALAELVDRSRVEVYANPEDIPELLQAKDELLSRYAEKIELQFVADSTVERGGCVLRTPQGAVDARIETQLSEVKRALLEAASTLLP